MELGYTRKQRIIYALQRHVVAFALAFIALALMWFLVAVDVATIKALTESIAEGALKITAFLLIMKFAYPNLEVQNAARTNPIVLACLLLAVAWLLSGR
jgi:hypothetical protein